MFPAGLNTLQWDGRDDMGRPAPSGVLFLEVLVGGAGQTRKFILLQ